MNVKFLAACAAAWLVLPLAASAASDSATVGLAKAGGDLLTPEDYIEYASINDVNIHELYFSAILYEGTESCLMCHQETAENMLGMGHFRWQGKVENIVGQKGQDFGKNQLLNNFCIAVPTNEPRCTQCHTGYGYADKNYNFNDPANIDCLVCHDQSGTYAKAPKTAGLPEPGVDLNAVARSIALGGNPTIDNCIDCHVSDSIDFTALGCIGCHGVDGTGNIMLGAPNLTDEIWLYGNSAGVIKQTILNGRNGVMPPWQAVLQDDGLAIAALGAAKDDLAVAGGLDRRTARRGVVDALVRAPALQHRVPAFRVVS